MKITTYISNCLDHYQKTGLVPNPPFAKTQKEIIDLIDLYRVDKFRDHNYDELGFLKPFYNIIETPVQVAANWMDLDVRDIRLIAESGQSYYPVWLMEKDLQLWMKDNKNCYADGRYMSFGSFLNSFVPNWVRYGHSVLKKADNTIYLMPISNLIVEPGAETLNNARYIIEKHDYSPSQLRKKNWDNIEKAIKLQRDGHIFVYEIFGDIEGQKGNYFIVAVSPHKKNTDISEGIMLHKDFLSELPYKELPFEKIPGRWLGRGRAEQLFHSQIYQNTIAHYKARGAHWTSKHIYQSRDDTIDKNLMTEIPDGTVLTPNSEINPIAVEERNLHFYREEEERYDLLVDKLSFAWDVTRGQRPPAGLTLGQSVIQSQTAGSFYKRKQEELGLFLKDVLYDWIIPQFSNNKSIAHRISLDNFDEDELDRLRNLVITTRTNKDIVSYVARNGKIPDQQEYNVLRDIVAQEVKNGKDISIPKGFFKNLRYKINIVITGEQINLASKLTTLQTILVMISQNPTILQNKDTRKVFFELLDTAGISPTKFKRIEQSPLDKSIEIPPQKGGSVARTPAIATPSLQPTAVSL